MSAHTIAAPDAVGDFVAWVREHLDAGVYLSSASAVHEYEKLVAREVLRDQSYVRRLLLVALEDGELKAGPGWQLSSPVRADRCTGVRLPGCVADTTTPALFIPGIFHGQEACA